MTFLDLWFYVFHYFQKVLCHYYFEYFFCFIFYCLSGNLIMCLLHILKLSYNSLVFSFFHSFFSLCFSLKIFYWPVFKLTNSFLIYVEFTDKPIRHVSFLLQCFWFLAFHFYYFFRVPLSLLTLPISSCILYNLSIGAHILIFKNVSPVV